MRLPSLPSDQEHSQRSLALSRGFFQQARPGAGVVGPPTAHEPMPWLSHLLSVHGAREASVDERTAVQTGAGCITCQSAPQLFRGLELRSSRVARRTLHLRSQSLITRGCCQWWRPGGGGRQVPRQYPAVGHGAYQDDCPQGGVWIMASRPSQMI